MLLGVGCSLPTFLACPVQGLDLSGLGLLLHGWSLLHDISILDVVVKLPGCETYRTSRTDAF